MASAAAAKKCRRLSQPAGRLIYKPNVSLMDQGGGLERLLRRRVGHPGGGQVAQLVVHSGSNCSAAARSPSSMDFSMRVTSGIPH